jgi:1-deoxy-D-xylulose-5-phosphate reductoisomerase
VLNAANEIGVAHFLDGRIRFTAIPAVIRHAMDSVPQGAAETIEAVLEADRVARAAALSYVGRCAVH